MKRLLPTAFLALLGFSLLAGVSASERFAQELGKLQREWATINVAAPSPAQAEAFRALAAKAGTLAARYPDKVEPRIWEAIILGSYAQASGRYQQPESLAEALERIRAQQAPPVNGRS